MYGKLWLSDHPSAPEGACSGLMSEEDMQLRNQVLKKADGGAMKVISNKDLCCEFSSHKLKGICFL